MDVSSHSDVLIGTSGFVYKHWRRGVFYPEKLPQKQELEYFSQHFATVELNNPFYRLPPRETFEKWRDRTPAEFLFAVKASRYISHIKRLKDCAEPLERLMESAGGLGNKLGPILFQFPPTWGLDIDRLRDFLTLLSRRQEFTFEFRNPGWFVEPVYDLLRQHGAALCLAVSPTAPDPPEILTGRFTYVRMHAGSGRYGDFTEPELAKWQRKICRFRREGVKVYVYFNNDAHGCAIRDARRLIETLRLD